MKLFTKGSILKSYDVEVSTPHVLKWKAEFLQAAAALPKIPAAKEGQKPVREASASASKPETDAEEKAALILAKAEEDAAMIRVLAEADAEQIRRQAEAEAQEILDQAQTDINLWRADVTEAAQNEVYPAARAEGYQAGIEAGEEEGRRLEENANRLFRLAQRAVQEEYAKVDGDLIHLAIKIAERVVRASLAVEPRRLMSIIQALLLLPQEHQGWSLYVAGEDALWLKENQLPCPWIIDESLNQGDCYLDCQEGIFDARLAAQLEKLEHTLREELEHGGMAAISSEGGRD